MRRSRDIISVILVGILLLGGLPLYQMEDLSRDTRIDLKDVLLSVKNITNTAQENRAIQSELSDIVTTISVVAGLRTVIQSSQTEQSKSFSVTVYAPFLINGACQILIDDSWTPIHVQFLSFDSFVSDISSPPPKAI